MMKRFLPTVTGYLIWAAGAMLVSSVAFALVSFVHSRSSVERPLITGIFALLTVAYGSYLLVAELVRRTPLKRKSGFVRRIESAFDPIAFSKDAVSRHYLRSNHDFLCMVLRFDLEDQLQSIHHSDRDANAWNSEWGAQCAKLPQNENLNASVVLVNNIRANETSLRSLGILRLEIRKHFGDVAVCEAKETGRSVSIIMECKFGVKRSLRDLRHAKPIDDYEKRVVEIVGMRQFVKSVKVLHAPPALDANDIAIGVF